MSSVSYTKEELAKFKAELAGYLMVRNQIFEDNRRDITDINVKDVDEYLAKINKNRIQSKRISFLRDEVSRLTNILLEHLEEYQTPPTPGL